MSRTAGEVINKQTIFTDLYQPYGELLISTLFLELFNYISTKTGIKTATCLMSVGFPNYKFLDMTFHRKKKQHCFTSDVFRAKFYK